MTNEEVVIVGLSTLLLAVFVLSTMGIISAYRNGVTDGYGYSREPNCPGYAAAGEWLRENMAHRWPELAPVVKLTRFKCPACRYVCTQMPGRSLTLCPECRAGFEIAPPQPGRRPVPPQGGTGVIRFRVPPDALEK